MKKLIIAKRSRKQVKHFTHIYIRVLVELIDRYSSFKQDIFLESALN